MNCELTEIYTCRSAGGDNVADAAKKKFGDRLYNIFKEALTSTSNFSVLCHGQLDVKNVLYKPDGEAVLINFQRACYAHAVSDVHFFIASSASMQAADQTEFLIRFVYFETLAGALRQLGLGSSAPDYNDFKKEFLKKQAFGCLAGAMRLANSSPALAAAKRAAARRNAPSSNRVVESKFLGRIEPSNMQTSTVSDENHEAVQGPAARVVALLEKAVQQGPVWNHSVNTKNCKCKWVGENVDSACQVRLQFLIIKGVKQIKTNWLLRNKNRAQFILLK